MSLGEDFESLKFYVHSFCFVFVIKDVSAHSCV